MQLITQNGGQMSFSVDFSVLAFRDNEVGYYNEKNKR